MFTEGGEGVRVVAGVTVDVAVDVADRLLVRTVELDDTVVDPETISTAKLTERRRRKYFGDILCFAAFPRAT